MDYQAGHSHLVRLGLQGVMFVLGLSLAGCPQPVPRVPIPSSDASPPTMVWQMYNLQKQERREIVQDGQTINMEPSEQVVVTLAVEDLNSGVKDVTLSGSAQYACEQGGQVENNKFQLETQEAKPTPDHENKVPVSASLVYTVDLGKYGCKEKWRFAGGKVSLVGKGHNFVNGAAMKTLHFNLKMQPPDK